MSKPRTKRKNLQKRKKRRLFATIAAELQSAEDAQWTLEQRELEQMRNEEERQRVHEQWLKAVAKSDAAFEKRKKVLKQRQQLIQALRQQLQSEEG